MSLVKLLRCESFRLFKMPDYLPLSYNYLKIKKLVNEQIGDIGDIKKLRKFFILH